MRPVVRAVVALAVSLSVLQATSAPADAFEFKGKGLYARFGPSSATTVRGLVIVDRANFTTPAIDLNLLGLRAMEVITINFRSIGCGGQPARSNRIVRLRDMADENGHLFARTSSSQGDWASVKSVWINQDEVSLCRRAVPFEVMSGPGAGPHVAALGHAHSNDPSLEWDATVLLERLPNDDARLTTVIGGLEGKHDIGLRIADQRCGTNPAETLVARQMEDITIAGFRSVVLESADAEIFTQNDNSLRVRGLNGSGLAGCGPLSIIAILVAL